MRSDSHATRSPLTDEQMEHERAEEAEFARNVGPEFTR